MPGEIFFEYAEYSHVKLSIYIVERILPMPDSRLFQIRIFLMNLFRAVIIRISIEI